MATVRMSEKEAIARGLLKPEEATPEKSKIRYIRVPTVEVRTKYLTTVIGPGVWHLATIVLGWLLGYTMGIMGRP